MRTKLLILCVHYRIYPLYLPFWLLNRRDDSAGTRLMVLALSPCLFHVFSFFKHILWPLMGVSDRVASVGCRSLCMGTCPHIVIMWVDYSDGLATYFRFSFRFFMKGSCQLLAKVCARSTG